MEILHESIYDHPRWYDLVFGTDCAAEIQFIEACAAEYVTRSTKRMLEPACGTGRLLLRLAQKGYQLGGLDLNTKAVEFCNARLVKNGFKPLAWVADMSNFTVKKPYDVSFNTINSFRHLSTEKAAEDHLRCMAQAIRPGGIYLLGLHLTPTEGTPEDEEAWSARRGHLAIQTWMWPIEKLPRKRLERYGMRFDVRTPTQHIRIEDELRLRSYTHKQIGQLIAAVPEWEVAGTYDFHYDLEMPITVGPRTEDVVFVLRRKK